MTMEYEQNYSEMLREQPIAGVKAILDYAQDQVTDLIENEITDTHERPYYEKLFEYWALVSEDCRQELEFRIKQIFP